MIGPFNACLYLARNIVFFFKYLLTIWFQLGGKVSGSQRPNRFRKFLSAPAAVRKTPHLPDTDNSSIMIFLLSPAAMASINRLVKIPDRVRY